MSLDDTVAESQALQFDRVVTESPSSADPGNPAVACAACQTSIETEYYQINGSAFCDRCRQEIASAAQTPRGLVPLVTGGIYGLGAGIVGAAIYYAVIAITNFEIGIVAILIGYMVGYAIRKGARGRGGRRFQVLAVALTYASVALAYAPLAIKGALDADRKAQTAVTSTATDKVPAAGASESGRVEGAEPDAGSFLVALVFLVGIIAVLPVLVIVGSLPLSLISGLIIFIGMRQAWSMTGTPSLEVLGPYSVGAAPQSTAV